MNTSGVLQSKWIMNTWVSCKVSEALLHLLCKSIHDFMNIRKIAFISWITQSKRWPYIYHQFKQKIVLFSEKTNFPLVSFVSWWEWKCWLFNFSCLLGFMWLLVFFALCGAVGWSTMCDCSISLLFSLTVNLCKTATLKEKRKLVFKTNDRLMQVQIIADCSMRNILQYVWPSLSYNLSFSLFVYFWVAVLHMFYCTFFSVILVFSVEEWADWSMSYLVRNPKDMFSSVKARIISHIWEPEMSAMYSIGKVRHISRIESSLGCT